jgi:hypothetical protein
MAIMKYIYQLLLLSCIVLLGSCEKDLPTYSYKQNMLNFVRTTTGDTLRSYSFVYSNEAQVDTVWYTVTTMGYVVNEDRPLELEQLKSDSIDAVAGVDYVSFDDTNLKKMYYIPSGAVEAKIPIVVLRNSALSQHDVELWFTFKANGYFTKGYEAQSVAKLVISNKLTRPSNWDLVYDRTTGNGYLDPQYFFGDYGPVKHQFMIDMTGQKWDDDYLTNTLHIGVDDSVDSDYLLYLSSILQKKLDALNAERATQGLAPLTEADGTQVVFTEQL